MTVRVRPTDLLIAPPHIQDGRFKNAVMMLTHDQVQGSFALCLNRPTDYTLPEILEQADIDAGPVPNIPIYWGGPMSPTTLWMLHSTDWIIDSSVMLSDEWAMTSNVSMFHHLADTDTPKHFRLVMGYAGWGAGQLRSELDGVGGWRKENSWLVAHNLGPEWICEQAVEDLWTSMITLSSHQAVDSWL